MSNDLISREALKKALEVTQYNDIDDLTRTERLIDNAPTVDPYQGEECVNIKMSEEEIKQFKQMLQERKPIYTITSDNVPTVEIISNEERLQGDWIPVSERLPDIAKKCILQLSDGYITMGTYHSIGKWTFVEIGIAYAYGKETVTAWMPLPAAYKEDENE